MKNNDIGMCHCRKTHNKYLFLKILLFIRYKNLKRRTYFKLNSSEVEMIVIYI